MHYTTYTFSSILLHTFSLFTYPLPYYLLILSYAQQDAPAPKTVRSMCLPPPILMKTYQPLSDSLQPQPPPRDADSRTDFIAPSRNLHHTCSIMPHSQVCPEQTNKIPIARTESEAHTSSAATLHSNTSDHSRMAAQHTQKVTHCTGGILDANEQRSDSPHKHFLIILVRQHSRHKNRLDKHERPAKHKFPFTPHLPTRFAAKTYTKHPDMKCSKYMTSCSSPNTCT